MGALNRANIKKTIYYFQRNGLKHTWYAVRERLGRGADTPYQYEPPSQKILEKQRSITAGPIGENGYAGIDFSIVVPLYRTRPDFLRELIKSIQEQSYPYWEVVFADATDGDSVRKAIHTIAAEDCRVKLAENPVEELRMDRKTGAERYGVIRYIHLSSNEGISANTNAALSHVRMHYVGLLDHDDLLTPDALFEMAEAIRKARDEGNPLRLVYSDEDKCNEDASSFYEPHYKEEFNYDLILSNNYICHFMVMESTLMQMISFRSAYDGAQDYDLVLRTVTELQIPFRKECENQIGHVPKVLYHWRCHASSTAENPRSKEYAYEAGRQALQDFLETNRILGRAVHKKHVGFYEVRYEGNIWEARPDVGIIGGPVVQKGKITGGRMDGEGRVFYEGLSAGFSGYMNRAVLTQDAETVDIRNMALRKELWSMFEKITGVPYRQRKNALQFDSTLLPKDADLKQLSKEVCNAVRSCGYRILWSRGDYE